MEPVNLHPFPEQALQARRFLSTFLHSFSRFSSVFFHLVRSIAGMAAKLFSVYLLVIAGLEVIRAGTSDISHRNTSLTELTANCEQLP